MSDAMSFAAMADECAPQAVQYHSWAEAKRRANEGGKLAFRWPDHDIAEKDARAERFERMARWLRHYAPHEAAFQEFMKGRAA